MKSKPTCPECGQDAPDKIPVSKAVEFAKWIDWDKLDATTGDPWNCLVSGELYRQVSCSESDTDKHIKYLYTNNGVAVSVTCPELQDDLPRVGTDYGHMSCGYELTMNWLEFFSGIKIEEIKTPA